TTGGLEEVIVTGIRASLNDSLESKKADDHVVEVISADNIGQLPNVTVAESLVRLPGINGARDRGNESLATVRGLGPRMTMGTVNGREVASSEPNRNVRWEVFPTEVVSTVKVYKSQSADLIAGGIAGTIDIGTIHPLDYTGPAVIASAAAVYYDEGESIPGYDPLGMRFGGSWIGQVNDSLAFALGGTFQNQKNAYPSMGSWGYTGSSDSADVNGDGTADPTPWGAATEVKQLDQDRQGVMGAMQWRAGNMDLNLDALYSKVTIDEKQNQTWFQGLDYSIWSSGNKYTAPGSSYDIVNGDVVGGTLANSYNRMDHVVGKYSEDKTLAAVGLNTAWTGDKWSFLTDLSYSKAERENIWQAVDLVSFPATTSYNWADSVTPTVSVSSVAFDGPPAPDWNGSSGQSAGPESLQDEIAAAAATLSRKFDGVFSGFDVGARYAKRTKNHEYFSWNQAGSNAPLSAYDGLLPRFDLPDLNVPSALNGNLNELAEIAIGGFNPALAREDILQRWEVEEETAEGFLRATFESETSGGIGLKGNVGVRFVQTDTTSTGYDQINGVNTPANQGNSYDDVLPSATLNVILNAEHILRFSAAKVLARPPLDELRTGRSLADPLTTVGQLTGSGANPDLEPFRADQFDVSYEWYFHPESMLAVALFTKSVESTIGYKQDHEQINGYDYLITGPFNGGGGHINGVELTFQTPFYFLGLDDFGLYSNYAYVDSNLKEFAPAGNPVPLSGLAEDTGTVDLWYNNGPVELRLGYKYHSPYTIIYGWNSQAISRLESEGILDASASWQVNDMFGLKLQVGNLTNEPLRAYFDNKVDRLANKDGSGGYQVYGRRYMLELVAKF
ncbi:MAG TPA: TonB-dependent receptor, partial [Povalibacter sp.]